MGEVGGLGPEEVATLRAALAAAEARAALAEAKVSDAAALIAHLRLEITKLKRDRFGQRSERTQRLLDQYELQLEELEASATADELAAEQAAAKDRNGGGLHPPPAASPALSRAPAARARGHGRPDCLLLLWRRNAYPSWART